MSNVPLPRRDGILQECSRMNALLTEIRRSLVELDKGLKGQLNMSQSMEDLATAFGLNEWPGRNPFAQVIARQTIRIQ